MLETAVAVSLLALAAAMGYPRLSQAMEFRQLQLDLDTAGRALRWSRSLAMMSGDCVRLCLAGDEDCAGPGSRLELYPCGADAPVQAFDLKQGTAVWRGLRRGIGAGFDGDGLALAVTGSLYLCTAVGGKAIGRLLVNRSGRIRLADKRISCPAS